MDGFTWAAAVTKIYGFTIPPSAVGFGPVKPFILTYMTRPEILGCTTKREPRLVSSTISTKGLGRSADFLEAELTAAR